VTSSTDGSPVTRKVQLAGSSTFTVSLPKEWATAHGLETGREVNLYPSDDGSLVVRVGPRDDDDGERVVAGDDLSPANLSRTVRQLYAAGEDRFRVVADETDVLDADQCRALTDAGTDLTGVEVDDRATDEVGFRNVLNPSKVSLSQTVLNLQHVALSMHRDAVRAATDADADLATAVVDGPGVDRQFLLVVRQFERALDGFDRPEASEGPRPVAFDHYAAATHLRRVADNAERIARVALDLHEPIDDDAASTLDDRARTAERLVEDAVGIAVDEDPSAGRQRAYEVLAEHDRFREAVDPLAAAEGSDRPAAVALVSEKLLRTAAAGRALAERAVRAAARSD